MDTKFARLSLYQNGNIIRKLAIKRNLKGVISVGRKGAYGAIIDLPVSYVSRQHAELLVYEGNKLLVRDLGSKGGTFVNGERIQEALLNDNDIIQFSTLTDGYKLVVNYITPQEIDYEPVPSKLIDVPKGMVFSGGSDTSDLAGLLSHKPEIIIGRSADVDISLPQLTITRRHAAILKQADGSYLIKDLGSRNGTFVNGERIEKPTTITEADDILIGNYRFRLNKPAQDIRQYNAIIAQNLVRTVNKGKITILNDISFKIPDKQFVAIMGPSGCGKSTLLKALNGDFPASSGKVYIHNMELYHNYDYLKRMIGYVPQDDIVHKELSVESSLYYAAKLRLSSDVSNEDIRQKIDEVLTNLNINDADIRKRAVGDLSGGQRKRVSIAVELLTDPAILFLDEPTSPLDPETIEDFLLCVKALAQKGTTILMVTHKPNDLDYVDKVIFLSKGGHLTYFGSKENYLEHFDAKNVIEVYAKNGTIEAGKILAQKFKDSYPHSGLIDSPNEEPNRRRNESFFKQWFWLTARYFNIKTNDRVNTAILIAQAPIIAGLLALIFAEVELSVLFFTAISAIWFGTNNAAKEIVGELPIYRRERMFNLRILPYVLSKIVVLTFFSALQVMLFIGIIYLLIGNDAVQINNYWGYVGIMLYLAFSASLMGLLVSALLTNTEKVMSVIPIVLIPQIILAGVITTLTEGSAGEYMSYAMFSRWGTEGFAFVQDSIRSYTIVNPLEPECLDYRTVDAVDFINLPNSIGLNKELSRNMWAISAINLLLLLALLFTLKRKDSV